ncbi:fimbrial biogenesis chaperone [Klebsiella variicola]|uniref:fimbrial biogenesis chaperone n=1 Tax=Klebsiella variicola TaxID=244366 RepID=UPI0009BB9275|nr:fimbria/pilus periplasmic chaperone [Klebsiella variicola]HCB0793757.1 fimbria/pilus periplasmic chaperone [Klebsiella variicola subsp. variicola]EIW9274527.1 fimbria/pilus periplasmic chaperone [Klebsiella variicola]ELC9130628.1 fimbria/pilus periplasmic chaperone [Klebsiella variicola]MBZ6721057.1 fimbria/pilus periplasmic chaperone [Klebsiella variicola]MDU5052801.1 fimbria/pilus periplasmic chaperone [Klebsiella variicola]
MFNFKAFVLMISMSATWAAQAAISLDRTRIIYGEGEKSISLVITNENNQLPYLAQSWIEDDKHEKITTGPLVVIPPVQRLEAGTKSQLRLMATPGISNLPRDRESLFYFNLREIPPKSEKENTLQIALQTQVKLFYRPATIKAAANKQWQDQIVLTPVPGGYYITNPTPYYVTIIGLGSTQVEAEKGKFEAVMIAPKSGLNVKATQTRTPWLTFINDYGGRPTLPFRCEERLCIAAKKS